MKFINLTPHAIVLNNGMVFPPSGEIARVASSYTNFDENGICKAVFGEVTGLPQPSEGVTFIVSGMVASAVRGRKDVVSPSTGHPSTIRNDGQVVSVQGFIQA